MQDNFVASLVRAISVSRLKPYLDRSATARDGLALYLWNGALAESLYPVLQALEITLRNSIHNSVSRYLGRDDWFAQVLVGQETRVLASVTGRLKTAAMPPQPDDLVAALPLGFWVNLFFSRYEQKLWPRLLQDVFPYLPAKIRTRDYVSRRLYPIRYLRNRVFHHEPIWHWHDLERHYKEAIEVIGWVNPDMLDLLLLVDRFPETYSRGPEEYRDALAALGGNRA